MKKILAALICVLLTPLYVFACPAGDEFGRPYFEIFNPDYTAKTMFYLGGSHYYRRELCLITDVHSIREAFNFPIVGRSVPELYGVGGEIFYPSMVDAGGTHFRINVGLRNTFEYWKNFIEDSPNPIDEMFFEVLVERLHDDEANEHFQRAVRRMEERGITQALSHTLRIDHGVIFGDRVFNEIRDDLRVMFEPELHDPITVYMCDCFFHFTVEDVDVENIVAVNIDHFTGQIRYYPVEYENNLFSFAIQEPGTFVLVSDFSGEQEEAPAEPYEPQENGGNPALIIAVAALAIGAVIACVAIAMRKKGAAKTKKAPPKRSKRR